LIVDNQPLGNVIRRAPPQLRVSAAIAITYFLSRIFNAKNRIHECKERKDEDEQIRDLMMESEKYVDQIGAPPANRT
jgi:hypothetical protein